MELHKNILFTWVILRLKRLRSLPQIALKELKVSKMNYVWV